jgi:transcription antitermination factor NusB
MRKRTQSRECALKILYQAELTRREIHLAAEKFWGEFKEIDENIQTFSDRLTSGIEKNLDKIDNKISEHATNWQLKRMAVIDRNVLRIGVFELLHTDDIPPKVTINEAVELAKKYGDLESSKFVNGILDKIHKLDIAPKEKK